MSNRNSFLAVGGLIVLLLLAVFATKVFVGIVVFACLGGLGYLWSKRDDKGFWIDRNTYI